MKTADEMYPNLGEEGFYGPGDYGPVLESIGAIAIQVDDDNYQGDSRVLYRGKGDCWGVLLFGWGSCSGCDSLQACSHRKEIEELRDDLATRVRWGTREEILAYLMSKDFETESSYREDKIKQFVSKATSLLAAQNTQ
jgi:hypothetical protein